MHRIAKICLASYEKYMQSNDRKKEKDSRKHSENEISPKVKLSQKTIVLIYSIHAMCYPKILKIIF